MAVAMKTGQSARLYHTQQVHYLYKRWNGSDVDPLSTGKTLVGVLPASCFPLETIVRVNAAFSSGEIIVGTSVASSSAAFVSTVDVLSSATGSYISDRFMGTLTTVDLPVYVQSKTSGQTATGQVDVWVSYLPTAPNTTA